MTTTLLESPEEEEYGRRNIFMPKSSHVQERMIQTWRVDLESSCISSGLDSIFIFNLMMMNSSVSPSLKKGHGKVSKKRALSARGDMQRGHF